jgi:hypothetical protein
MNTSAIDAARQQLEYWKQQRDIAVREAQPERAAQCRKFIAQCELVISALDESRAQRIAGADRNSRSG